MGRRLPPSHVPYRSRSVYFVRPPLDAQVPYFLVSPKEMPLDGSTPTLLYGYGGFEISLTPGYAAQTGAAWLEKGYAYVQARAPVAAAQSLALAYARSR